MRLRLFSKVSAFLAFAAFGACPAIGDDTFNFAALVQQEDGGGAEPPSSSDDEDDSDASLRKALNALDSPLPLADSVEDQIESAKKDSLFAGRETAYIDGRLSLPPIQAGTTNMEKIGNGAVPEGFRDGSDAPAIPLPETGTDRSVSWQWQMTHWAAANTFSHPLYFEDRMLERHGHQRFPCLQPMVSGGRFLAQWAALPYNSVIGRPWDCDYLLGDYRVGNCAPKMLQRPPYKRKAAVLGAACYATGALAIP